MYIFVPRTPNTVRCCMLAVSSSYHPLLNTKATYASNKFLMTIVIVWYYFLFILYKVTLMCIFSFQSLIVPHDIENGQENVFQSENVTLKWKHKRVEWNEYNVYYMAAPIDSSQQLCICISIMFQYNSMVPRVENLRVTKITMDAKYTDRSENFRRAHTLTHDFEQSTYTHIIIYILCA